MTEGSHPSTSSTSMATACSTPTAACRSGWTTARSISQRSFPARCSGTSKRRLPTESPPNTGYLLFEKADGQPDLVSSEKLGFNLHRRNVPLVILSACQSAAQGDNEEPLGSVAVRLTAAGIPAVLAMTHSVLVHTTRALFGEFYAQLASHRTIGEALDAARLHLFNNPEKYEVQRGPDRKWLKLYDWFVPALYQAGADVPLIREG